MIKRIKIYKDLPIEEGKTYTTRFQTGEKFFVKTIKKTFFKSGDYSAERIIGIYGIYLEHEHIGLCPLSVDRLIPEREYVGDKIVCDDPEFDLTDLIKKAFEAGQIDKGNNWYDGDVQVFLNTIK